MSVVNGTKEMVDILIKYQRLNDTQLQPQTKRQILEEILNIDPVRLINNFNSILTLGSDEFETMNETLLNRNLENQMKHLDAQHSHRASANCNLAHCQMIRRNNRDRIGYSSMTQIYYGISDDSHIIIIQLLDKIHCLLFHSFDFGFKLRKNEIEYIQATTQHLNQDWTNFDIDIALLKIKELISKKIQQLSGIGAFNNNKFLTLLNKIKKKDEKKKDESKDEEIVMNGHHNSVHGSAFPDTIHAEDRNARKQLFSFGKRWRYSKKYENNDGIDKVNKGKYNEWFVSHKYKDLKREMLSNSIKKIPMKQWTHLLLKADLIMKCEQSKYYRSCKNIKYELSKIQIQDISKNASLTVDHILVILIFCNFAAIKNNFISTFALINQFESWAAVRSKHSEYANFGRILCEMVECFGVSVYDKRSSPIFYHSIQGSYELQSFEAKFFSPASMTTELSVITCYCNEHSSKNNALLFGMVKNDTNKMDLKYMDCSWLSDFCGEREVVFLGGRNSLKFEAIYSLKTCRNYEYYITAINLIDQSLIKGVESVKHSTLYDNNYLSVFHAFEKLLENQIQESICIPQHIDHYLNNWCNSRKAMFINMRILANDSTFKQLLVKSGLLIVNNHNTDMYCISIDFLLRLFPNAINIKIHEPIFDMKCQILSNIFEVVSYLKFYGLYLQSIELIAPICSSNHVNLDQIVSDFRGTYFKAGWDIKMMEFYNNNNANNGDNHMHMNQYADQQNSDMQAQHNDMALRNPNIVIQLIKHVESPRRSHHSKSLSTPSAMKNQTQYNDDIKENQDISSDFDRYTPDEFISVHITMKVKHDENTRQVEFDFSVEDTPENVANDMINELNLPVHYKREIIDVIKSCIPSATNSGRIRARSYSNVSLIDFKYPRPVHMMSGLGSDIDEQSQMDAESVVDNLDEQSSAGLSIIHEKQFGRKKSPESPQMTSTNDLPRKRKNTISLFDEKLNLPQINSDHKVHLSANNMQVFADKKYEFKNEFSGFLNTQSEILQLKFESLKMGNNEMKDEEKLNLASNMKDKIDTKKSEIIHKWNDFVTDQKEIIELKRIITEKTLVQFKTQIHFEHQMEYQDIMKSKLDLSEKEKLKRALKEYRENMISDYREMTRSLYEKYENKLSNVNLDSHNNRNNHPPYNQ